MISPSSNPCQQKQLLSQFVRQVDERNDTPSLILLIAADADHLRLCRSIVDPTAGSNPTFAATFMRVCLDNGIISRQLTEKLTPAARALGIVQASDASRDYYHLLGIRSRANTREIKNAFRKEAVKVHPDTNANLPGSGRRFVELNDAYRTLRDPVLRHRYDTKRHYLPRWCERPDLSMPAASRSAIFFWYFFGLFFIFILLLLFLDMIVFQ
ncbi:J domain-containing protein [uncultured Desulfosarcina sp.]|uniref:J domain-containing protein n=1 Tax=uncultured Desulfosarcina sp. TaxID=218289 RepID=UPI0029C80654|nr:J domain-containing protein [uncultured Desulfosarcina sp.]